ncbi:hypothetical protein L9F63_000552, partial [Diploptera punctata]
KDEDQNYLKFLVVSLSLWIPIFICCWYGEELTQQGLEIQEVAYASKWYNSCTKYKKDLQFVIVRSQTPVILNGGGFFPINLNGFSA